MNIRMLLVVLVTLCAVISRDGISSAEECSMSFSKVGCYKDKYYSRTTTFKMSYRKQIDWTDPVGYQGLLNSLACKCAQKASENNMAFFGLQYWGECWIGEIKSFIHFGSSGRCFMPSDTKFNNTCVKDSGIGCVGGELANYVYKIVAKAPCEDKLGNCSNFKKYCDNDQYAVKEKCPRTCGTCS